MRLDDVTTADLLAKVSASAHIAEERLTEYAREYLRRRALASTKAGQGI